MPSTIFSALCFAASLLSASAFVIDRSNGNVTVAQFLADPSLLDEKYDKRDPVVSCGSIVTHTYTINGNGNPHQNFKITELGGTMIGCPGSVSKGYSHTTGWSIGGGFNPGADKYDFASLSFSVSESTTNSITDTFSCDSTWANMCILDYQAVTAVSVTFWEHDINSCEPTVTKNRGTGVVYLPNANSQSSGGSVMRRGVNSHQNQKQCHGGSSDREVTFYCGPPGGPEWFNNQDTGPSNAYLNARQPPNCAIPIEAYDWPQGS